MKNILKMTPSREAETDKQSLPAGVSVPAAIVPAEWDLPKPVQMQANPKEDPEESARLPISWDPPPAGLIHLLLKPDGNAEQQARTAAPGSLGRRGGSHRQASIEPILGVTAAGVPVAMVWRPVPAGTGLTRRERSDEERLEKICEWREIAAGQRNQAHARAAFPPERLDETEACRQALAYREALMQKTQAAENECMDLIRSQTGLSKNIPYEAFWDRTAFLAQDFVRFPTLEKTRRWFRLQTELAAVEKVVAGSQAKTWLKRLGEIKSVAEDFARADLAWTLHVQFYKDVGRKARADDAMDWLVAWAAGEVGEAYLLPLLINQESGATPEENRQQLLREMWCAVLALRPAKLSVSDFRQLPKAAATHVRKLHTLTKDSVRRLKPATVRCLDDMTLRPPDPLEKLLEKTDKEMSQARLAVLPSRQRRTVELWLEDHTYEQIAEIMGCGLETVKTQLARARDSLRKHETQMPERK